MANAGQVLDLARSKLGYVEGPRDNETPFGAWSGANFQPWCHSFVSWILDQVGAPIGKIAYCPTGVAYFRNKGQLYTTPQPGDIGYLWFPTKNRYAHVYIVEKVDGDYVVTLEGNTNTAGSRTGGGVFRLRRQWRGTKTVFGRPDYTSAPVYVPVPAPVAPTPLEETQVAISVSRPQGGYVVLQTADGGVFTYDGAPYYGSLPSVNAAGKVVGLAWTPSGNGYWILGADGAVFSFGDAVYKGGVNAGDLVQHFGNRKAIGIVASGDGYKIIGQDVSGDGSPYDGYGF